MTIEEKAKAYDEAVNEIKNLRDILLKEDVINENGIICDNFNRIFPELTESEDEKIRKSLINYINCYGNGGDFTKEEYIAWVKKQGEPKSIEWSGKIGSKHATGKLKEMIDKKENTALDEDDERMIESIIKHLERQKNYQINTTNLEQCQEWLKYLKCKVQLKQE